MNTILTLTLNAALDKTTTVERLQPESKLRCEMPKYEPGGGGINVSRVLKRLGVDASAIFAEGGTAGDTIEQLLRKELVPCIPIPISGATRENLTVFVKSTQRQYRFVMPGATLSELEWRSFLHYFEKAEPSPAFVVASGSLPEGVPADFYSQLANILRAKGSKLVLDSSGEPLQKALETGVFLIKPNLKELSTLLGKEALNHDEQEQTAMQLVESGKCEKVVVSLGARGAMLASKKGIEYATPPTVQVKSTVGAGDSMVAGIVWALLQGWDDLRTLRYGVACGTATTMNTGTELCHHQTVEEIFALLNRC